MPLFVDGVVIGDGKDLRFQLINSGEGFSSKDDSVCPVIDRYTRKILTDRPPVIYYRCITNDQIIRPCIAESAFKFNGSRIGSTWKKFTIVPKIYC